MGELMDDHAQRFLALDGTLFDVFLVQGAVTCFQRMENFCRMKILHLKSFRNLHGIAQIAVMPDRGSVFDPVFFSGDLETGRFCVAGADWYGLDLFQQFAPGMQGLWGMMPLPAWKNNQGKLGPRTATFAGQGLMICKSTKYKKEAWDFIEFIMKNKDSNAERLQGNSFPFIYLLGKTPVVG